MPKNKVNLFLVGAAKSGTTSLWSALGRHPDIYITENELYKEPAFFCELGSKIGIDTYHRLFEKGERCKYRLDASTAYLTSPEAAERIYRYNPDAKILIILRNPIERAYSLYCWMTASGYEWAPTFEKALKLEENRHRLTKPTPLMPQYYWNYMYKRSGIYSEQIERFTNLFKNNVLILSYHDLIQSPEKVLSTVFSYLQLPITQQAFITKENPSKRVLDARITFLARKINSAYIKLLPWISNSTIRTRDWLVRMTLKKDAPPPMSESTRKMLENYYRDEFAILKKTYGIIFP